MTPESIAKALGGRKAGGGWTAQCPAHDDRTPSLSNATRFRARRRRCSRRTGHPPGITISGISAANGYDGEGGMASVAARRCLAALRTIDIEA
jgi:hypothetical protein